MKIKVFLLRIKILYYLGCGKFDTQVDADTSRSRPKIVLHKPLRWNSLALVDGVVQNLKSSLDSLYFGWKMGDNCTQLLKQSSGIVVQAS